MAAETEFKPKSGVFGSQNLLPHPTVAQSCHFRPLRLGIPPTAEWGAGRGAPTSLHWDALLRACQAGLGEERGSRWGGIAWGGWLCADLTWPPQQQASQQMLGLQFPFFQPQLPTPLSYLPLSHTLLIARA